MKKFNLKGVLDNLRSSVSTPAKSDTEIEETLRPDHFQICKTVRHGFPHKPTAMAYDPVQNLLAIGNKNGSLRIFGRPGVDRHIRHDGDVAIIQILFLVNEGALVTACSDDTLNLWNYRQNRPEIVNTLKFQRERLTFCHLPFQSKWLYVGTERGNVHVVNIETFMLSGYVINWNKAIELSRKTHPGPVVHLSDNPMDPNKLLIGFESGCAVLWDLKSKTAEFRYQFNDALKSCCWHHEGKLFMCSHADGNLTTWNYRQPTKPVSETAPHAKLERDGRPEACKPIGKVEWSSVRNTDPFVIFSGGMSYDKACKAPSITVIRGKSTTVLEMEHNVVDFITLSHSPWTNDFRDPYGIVVLLQNDLVVVDLLTPGYPCFENPYPMDLHESPVTACAYICNPPGNLIPAFYSCGSKQKRSGFSDREWPIKGGEWGTSSVSYSEIIITGHADGSLKIWDASAVTLQVLYKVKTSKIFERHRKKDRENADVQDEDPFAIQIIYLDRESRVLVVAGVTHVIIFKFNKQEMQAEVPSLEVSIVYENRDEIDSPEMGYELSPPSSAKPSLGQQHSYSSMGSFCSNTSDSGNKEVITNVKVKSGARKWNPGYQPDLVCMLTYNDGEPPGNITSISYNSTYSLLVLGNEHGLAIVDSVQKACLLNMATPDLYGSLDPYQRLPKSPKTKRAGEGNGLGQGQGSLTEDCKSPSTEQNSVLMRPGMSKCKRPQSMPVLSVQQPSVDLTGNYDQEDDSNVEVAFEAFDEEQELVENAEKGCLDVNQEQDYLKRQSLGRSRSAPLSSLLSVPATTESEENLSDDDGEEEYINNNEKSSSLPNSTSSSKLKRSNSAKRASPQPSPQASPQHSPKMEKNRKSPKGSHSPSPCNSPSSLQDGQFFDDEDDSRNLHEKPHRAGGYLRRMSVKIKNKLSSKHSRRHSSQPSPREEKHAPPSSAIVFDKVMQPAPSESSSSPKHKRKKPVKKEILVDFLDLRYAEEKRPHWTTCTVQQARERSTDKTDRNDFSRSRSSSMSSLENVGNEAVNTLVFTDSYTRKTDSFTCPCLWIGTSLGSVLVIVLNLPPSNDQRMTQPVIVSPSGTIFRLKGAILNMSFLDCNGDLIASAAEQWRDLSKEKERSRVTSSSSRPRISPTASTEMTDRQFAIICSEKQARVMSLPSQTCAYKVKLTESSFVTRAETISFRDSVCLACYVASGHIMTFSLPSLRPLLDIEFLPLTDLRIARTFWFGNNGNAVYFCSPSELQKITLSSETYYQWADMIGELFIACETPEAPKKGFFSNLFAGGSSSLDREELFGEASGKASKGLARHIPGGMAQTQAAAGTLAGDLQRTRMALTERGEKLGEVEERTAKMMAEAESYSSASHSLMNKYQNKKWYQF